MLHNHDFPQHRLLMTVPFQTSSGSLFFSSSLSPATLQHPPDLPRSIPPPHKNTTLTTTTPPTSRSRLSLRVVHAGGQRKFARGSYSLQSLHFVDWLQVSICLDGPDSTRRGFGFFSSQTRMNSAHRSDGKGLPLTARARSRSLRRPLGTVLAVYITRQHMQSLLDICSSSHFLLGLFVQSVYCASNIFHSVLFRAALNAAPCTCTQ